MSSSSSDSEAVSESEVPAPQWLRANFWFMGTWFALNHGVVTTPLVVASTLLGKEVANVGNAVLYMVTVFSSLLLGAPMVAAIGAKGGMLFGMLFYCVYIGCFTLAAFFTDDHDVALWRWIFFVGGSAFGGLAAGVLWTAQGGYFAASATKIAEAEGVPREVVTANLAGNFAFVYLGFEVLSKMGFSGLQHLNIQTWIIGALFLGMAMLSTAMMCGVHRFPAPGGAVRPMGKVLAAVSLWSDPVIWFLSPTNLTFGFCAAFMNGYVNAQFTAQELGKDWVAFMGAITAATASILARVYGPLAGQVGKGPVMSFGAACFFFIPVCLYQLHCCNGWGWWMIILYLLQGSGRSVYESTNRAMFSDFFPGPQTEGAFANCMLQASLSFALSFFLQNSLTGKQLASIIVVLAVLTPMCLVAARLVMHRRRVKAGMETRLQLSVEAPQTSRM